MNKIAVYQVNVRDLSCVRNSCCIRLQIRSLQRNR